MIAHRQLVLAAGLFVLLGTACAPRQIPGTTLRDTQDNREILDLMRRYKDAFTAQDPARILALASSRYLDPRDNIDYVTLQTKLDQYFARVSEVSLDILVRRIDVEGDHAQVDYFYSLSYLLAAPDAEWRTDSDDNRMVLTREAGQWKVLSGL